jgi:carbon storage regulator
LRLLAAAISVTEARAIASRRFIGLRYSQLPDAICKPCTDSPIGLVLGSICEREFTLVLVVSRKVGERILIGDQITVTVIKVGSGGVRIGIQAPRELAVVREELAELVRKAEELKIELAQQTTVDGESVV